MRNKEFILILLLLISGISSAQSLRVEPTFWWSGMQETELQLMVYGKDIANYAPQIKGDGVVIKEAVRLESPNYVLLYLDIANSKPGTFEMVFTNGKKKIVQPYELKKRTGNKQDIKGFDSSDVLYLIMPDRFANGNPNNDQIKMNQPYTVDRNDPNVRHGGDLKGISDRLDYLSDLGVTAIWLNPVLENDMEGGSYHGYATTNYYNVDPRFGTNDEYAKLIADAHSKGIKVVMDMIFNHCGSDHPWMSDVPSKDWFNNMGEYVETSHKKESYFDPYASEFDKRKMEDGWFVPTMPDLNQRNRHVAKYLIQNSIWWIEFSAVDGIRQDTYPYADYEMMQDWCEAIYKEYPHYNIVGEAWHNNPIGSAWWQANSKLNQRSNTMLKSVMDFRLMGLSHSAFAEETTPWDGGFHNIYDHLAHDFIYADVNYLLRFLDNHDTDRFLKEMPTDLGYWKQAITFLLTIPGMPQIYYGTELLMNGTKYKSDGYVRLDVPGGWPNDTNNQFVAEGRTPLQNDAFSFLRQMLHWRKGNDVVAYGKMKHYVPQNGVYLYERYLDNGKQVVIVMNGSSENREISLNRYAETLKGKASWTDILTNKPLTLGDKITLSPRQILILQ